MTRVVQLIAGLDIGNRHGGAERHGIELALALQPNFQIQVIAFWQTHSPQERHWQTRLETAGIPVTYITSRPRSLAASLAGIRRVAQLLRLQPVDILHSHFQLGSVAALLARRTGGSRVALRTAHVTAEWGRGCLAALLRLLFNRWLFPLGLDAVTGVSPAICRALIWHGQPAHYIPNGLPTHEPATATDIPHAGFLVGSVGRLTAQKDYPTLLRAIARLPEVSLCLVGDGEQRLELESLAIASGIADRVHFIGAVDNPAGYLAQFDLFVLPSLWEGLPTVLLEAMAAGIPVAASAIPGNTDLIRPGVSGWLFPPGNPPALAQVIQEVRNNPSQAQIYAALACESVAAYDYAHIARQYADLYRSLITTD
jgi:glycosyltransferase involved in cell wall biosynthesis